jgi:hypothetical protein
VPRNPYTALWSRLEAFRPESLEQLLVERRAVRIVVMRATIHLVSAEDALLLRPLTQPVLDAELARHPEFAPALAAVDLGAVKRVARKLLARPLTDAELRDALTERFPDADATALRYACRNLLACVQAPPRGLWSQGGRVTIATAESWLGRPLASKPSLDEVVVRYLGAFGPATAADLATWSRLTGFREVLDRLGPRLRTFRDERGRELVDLPDAPRPDESTPAPTRFLPEYDNVLLSHADRSRFVSPETRGRLSGAGGVGWGAVLHDGFGRGLWRLEREPKTGSATLEIRHAGALSKRAEASIAAEGRRLLRFLESRDAAMRIVEAC